MSAAGQLEHGHIKTPPLNGAFFESLEYEDEVDYELLCPICREPMLSPMITRPCQHVFCASCLQNAFLHQAQQRIAHHCPSCRTEFVVTDPDDEPAEMYAETLVRNTDNDLMNRLDVLRVLCPNEGCDVRCERFLLPDHVKNHCPNTVFPCYNTECSQQVQRRHMRLHCTHELIECRHCHEWLERYQYPEHELQCPELESPCSTCQAVMKRNEMKTHQQECEPPNFTCRGAKFGCNAVLDDADRLTEHESDCIIARLGGTIERQAELLQAHRDALLTLTRTNEALESRLVTLESDLRAKNEASAESSRLDAIERQLEAQQSSVGERVAKAELLSYNSVQRQGQFNQYMEACMARIQADLGAMHHVFMRGRMYPMPNMPMPKMPGDEVPRPGSEGSETISRNMSSDDDLMPPATRTMSATDHMPSGARGPEIGPFASLAAVLPNPGMAGQANLPQNSTSQQAFSRTRADTMSRPRRSSEERSVKL